MDEKVDGEEVGGELDAELLLLLPLPGTGNVPLSPYAMPLNVHTASPETSDVW